MSNSRRQEEQRNAGKARITALETLAHDGSASQATVNSSEAVENLIRVNSWNSWRLLLAHEFHENDRCHLGVTGLKTQSFTVFPTALLDSHY